MADGRMVARAWSLRPAPIGKTMLGESCGSGVACVAPSSAHATLCWVGSGLALKGPLPWRDPFHTFGLVGWAWPLRLAPICSTSVALGPGLLGPLP